MTPSEDRRTASADAEQLSTSERAKRLAAALCLALIWIAGFLIAWSLLYTVVSVDLWAALGLGMMLSVLLFWCLLIARDMMRKRRLEVVAYLANFFVDPALEIRARRKHEAEQAEKDADEAARVEEEKLKRAGQWTQLDEDAKRVRETAREEARLQREAQEKDRKKGNLDLTEEDDGNIAPASLRLALEKYLLDFDGLGSREDHSLIGEWKEHSRRLNKAGEQPSGAIEAIIDILKRTRRAINAERSVSARLHTFMSWLPPYLPFAALSALFFAQLMPFLVKGDTIHAWAITIMPWLKDASAGGDLPMTNAFWSGGVVEGLNEKADALSKAGILVSPQKMDAIARSLAIATMAFAGAYLVAWRGFVRGVISYELSPATFLRAFRNALTAVLVAVVMYLAVSPLEIGYGGGKEPSATEIVAEAMKQAQFTDKNDCKCGDDGQGGSGAVGAGTGLPGPGGGGQAAQQAEPEGGATPGAAPGGTTPGGAGTTPGASGAPGSGGGGGGQASTAQGAPVDVNLFWLLAAFVIGVFPDLGLAALVRQVQLGSLKRTREIVEKDVQIVPLELLDGIDYEINSRFAEFGITEVQHLSTSNPILLFVETPTFGLYQSIDWVAQAQLCTAVGPDAFLKLRQWRIRTVFDLERAVLAEHGASDYRVGVVRALIESSPQAAAIQQAVIGSDKAINDMTARALVRVLLDDLHVLRLRQVWKVIAERLGRRSMTIYDPDPDEKKAAKAAHAAEENVVEGSVALQRNAEEGSATAT